jgi:TRAP-type C4-dicarboxylate transport system substrate-binding protein
MEEQAMKTPLPYIDRRQFLRWTSGYGLTATVGALATAPRSVDAEEMRERIVAQAAAEKAKATTAEHTLIFGLDGVSNRWPDGPVYKGTMLCLGAWELKDAIERHSKGAIVINLQEGAALGGQVAAQKKVQEGVIGACNGSTQNMAAFAQVWNVTDFPYTIGPVENYWKLVYSKEIHDTLRATSMAQGVIILTLFPHTRWIELKKGLAFELRQPEQLKGLKIRVTGSRLEQEAFKILPANPTPVNWGEVYTSMKDGAIDGIHVGPAPVADASIQEVTGQLVDTEWMYNTDGMWLSTKWWNSLGAPLQEAILEAAYEAQLFIQKTYEPLFIRQLGIRPDSPPTSIWKKAGAKQVLLTSAERAVWQDFLSFERHKSRFQPLVERFGKREYEAIVRVANSPGTAEQRRWWKA